MRARKVRTVALLCSVGLLAPATLRAQTTASDKAAAEALFDQGKKALEAGNYAVACTKLEQSQHIDPAIGTLLYLAECYAKIGRTASAWATFRQGASEAQAAGEAERARLGNDEADKLQPKLSKLSIAVAPSNKSLTDFSILRGKEKVPRSLWGIEVPVDPGKISVVATAPGYRPWKKTVTVGPDAAHVAVSVPPLKTLAAKSQPVPPKPPPAAHAAPAPAPAPVPAPAPAPMPTPLKDTGSNGSTQRWIGLAVGGAGLIGIGIGSYFGLRAISKNNDAEKLCPSNNVCSTQQGVTLTHDAKSAALASDIAFGAGAAALVGGVVLFLTAPSQHVERSASSWHWAPSLGRREAGMALRGRF